ncbi:MULTISPECIES: hypothetical protein [unclassified Streptomyces]|uniref:hypothetical protein n=1 Tax=unclassified Streptomyces TaxID=2593676 RepID=UPI0011614C45|nr:hypothetical protein [Streptomyces sp. TSRI0107]
MAEETPSTSQDRDKHIPPWKRAKIWVIGIVAASITAALSGALSNLVTSTGESIRRLVFGDTREVVIKNEKGPILSVSVEQGDANGCNGSGWVYPHPPSSPLMKTPPGSGPRVEGKTWDQNPSAFGAAPAGNVTLYVSASARDNRAIILRNIKFKVVSRKPPIHGTRVVLSRGCGDSPLYHVGRVNFGAPPPYWVPVGDYMEGFRADVLRFPYKATRSDPATLLIDVNPGECHCSWRAELSWTDGDISDTTVIDDDGEPFELTPSDGLPVYTWESGKRVQYDVG